MGLSHLSTLISRVNHRVECEDFGALFEQAVINLMEYLDSWTDWTESERDVAVMLYDKHRPRLTGSKLPSHQKRLDDADAIRLRQGGG